MDFGGGDEIRFERLGAAGVVTLTRPKQLNAVTHQMVRALSKALAAWESDNSVRLVAIKAEGRAFSAGGDILHIYEAGKAGNPPVDFFADEYRLNAQIERFPKPYIALIDGIVMGGGVGVSVHGSHRVMTENAVFAMPEVGIGFFPDVGGSFFLPRLRGSFGIYLGLTGNRVRVGDALWAGIATHAVKQADLETVLAELAGTGAADAVLKRRCFVPDRDTDEAAVMAIARHFSLEDLGDVVGSLRHEAARDEEFARDALATMEKRSPTSLHVALRQMNAGAMLTMDECMQMEFRIVNRMLRGHDFYEGIRAAIIEKGASPAWDPPSLEAVDPASIEAYFEPLGEEELIL
jgi:enoyl-CoA hydratase